MKIIDDKKLSMKVTSPCVRDCCLNNDDICLGCFRHLNEITGWQAFTAEKKQAVLAQCEQRRIASKKRD